MMEGYLFDGRDHCEHNGVSFVGISKIFETQDAFLFGMKSLDRVERDFGQNLFKSFLFI